MLNILWVEDEYSEQKQIQFFKNRHVTVETHFDGAEKVINSDLNKYDVVVLDINLENSEHTENVKKYAEKYANNSEDSVREFLKKCGMNLYFMLLENGFPKDQIVFLTANANISIDSREIDQLRQAFDNRDVQSFKKALTIITSGFGDEDKVNAYKFIGHSYDEIDIKGLCSYLEACANNLNNDGQGKNTYEILCETANNCLIKAPRACVKGTRQLETALEEYEAKKYLVFRRGIIEGCEFLKNHIDNDDIRFRDFIKLENNRPSIEIPSIEIKNYLDALAQSLPIRSAIDESALNLQYRLFLRTLSHEWEENVEARSLEILYGNNGLNRIQDIYTYAWIMKMTRNWVSHANLLEPLNEALLAFLFLVNMRAMFRLSKSVQAYESILLSCINSNLDCIINIEDLSNNISFAYEQVDNILNYLQIPLDYKDKDGNQKHKHFGQKINEIYRRNTGNPDAEDHDYKKLLMQYFWVNQKQEANLRKLVANSDDFLPTLARHVYSISFPDA
jgi:hypothetical protein